MSFRSRFIGDKKFYMLVLSIALPMMIQNGITQLVNLLDNIMVGQVGTLQMSGVAIANQLIFVFNLAIFGGISGAGIFGAQFYGSGDYEGLRHAFRYKLYIGAFALISCGSLFLLFSEEMLMLFLHDTNGTSAADIAATLGYAQEYLYLMMIGLVPYTLAQCYASTLRESGKAIMPMVAGLVAVCTNLVLNYVLIFGNWGAPRLGVNGAAIATVISRFVELAIITCWTHLRSVTAKLFRGVYKRLRIPRALTRQITLKGAPLMLNELLWSLGMTTLMQCYSLRGLDVVAAMNISQTLFNLFSISFGALGSSIGIIVGNQLGAGDMEKARDYDTKLIFFSTASTFVMGTLLAVCSPYFPLLYNTTAEVRQLATQLLLVVALSMPIHGLTHATYFTLRSGGKTLITFAFDSGFVWSIAIPTAFVLSRFTTMHIVPLYLVIQLVDIIKCVLGVYLVNRGDWMQNIISDEAQLPEQSAVES